MIPVVTIVAVIPVITVVPVIFVIAVVTVAVITVMRALLAQPPNHKVGNLVTVFVLHHHVSVAVQASIRQKDGTCLAPGGVDFVVYCLASQITALAKTRSVADHVIAKQFEDRDFGIRFDLSVRRRQSLISFDVDDSLHEARSCFNDGVGERTRLRVYDKNSGADLIKKIDKRFWTENKRVAIRDRPIGAVEPLGEEPVHGFNRI